MKLLKIVLIIIGVSQLVLGALFLFAPQFFINWMGLSATGDDINYLWCMLAARFITFGFGMFYVARSPQRHAFWIDMMILTQIFDLIPGIVYTLSGTLDIKSSAFPMFNAFVFTVLLIFLRPGGRYVNLTSTKN